ncbi:MAG: DsbA family protein [Chloroflexi bacterium]|nr:DsbA family protein [Chloroflexota bacterium]
MTEQSVPELWQWAEYYCPWSYIAAVRLHHIYPEYQGRVRLRLRPFPLEVMGGQTAPRVILEQEWWLAAIQEPRAPFEPWRGESWPTTTLPAFEAAWCAARQDEALLLEYDLRIRRAFFAESRNIGQPDVLLEIAQETGLDVDRLRRDLERGEAKAAILEEAQLGQDHYRVRGTPTPMLGDGTKLHHPIAYPQMRGSQVVGVMPLPCRGEECIEATRSLFDRAIRTMT